LVHRDLTDLDDVATYYDTEIVAVDVSIFDFNKDHRVKYVMCYNNEIGPFGNKLSEYVPVKFIEALKKKNPSELTDEYEKFIYTYIVNGWESCENNVSMVTKRRVRYNFHNYIFIPLVLYCLRQVYNSIVCDTSVMDEDLLNKYSIEKGLKL
jgi:hypothetical protein